LKLQLDRWLGLGVAAGLCGVLSVGSVALAFLGSEESSAVMMRSAPMALVALFAAGLTFSAARSALRRSFGSALIHAGFACVMAGWLLGRVAERTSTEERPAVGSMAMIAGDVSDKLWGGLYLTNYVGRVPFTVKLEQFFVDHYDPNDQDRDAGRMPPVREYRSRVTISEPGQDPYVVNVRVNHPARVQGYHIYQMSWGQSTDASGQPVTYTVLQFIRDPGLPVVYAGFVVLFVGILLFAAKVWRASGRPEPGEVPR